jgi:hypothetical protein
MLKQSPVLQGIAEREGIDLPQACASLRTLYKGGTECRRQIDGPEVHVLELIDHGFATLGWNVDERFGDAVHVLSSHIDEHSVQTRPYRCLSSTMCRVPVFARHFPACVDHAECRVDVVSQRAKTVPIIVRHITS